MTKEYYVKELQKIGYNKTEATSLLQGRAADDFPAIVDAARENIRCEMATLMAEFSKL